MRDPSLERKKPTPFLKVVMFLPRSSPSTTLGVILSANKLVLLLGTRKCKSSLGETTKILRRKGLCWKTKTHVVE